MAKLTLKNTKNEILRGYNQALEQTKKLETQIRTLQKEKGVLSDKLEAGSEGGPNPNSVSGIIEILKTVEVGIAKAISETAALQVIEAEKLETLQADIAKQHADIQALYDIEIGDDTLETLIDKYLTEKEEFEDNYEDKKKQFTEERNEKNDAWDKECDEHRLQIRERNQEAKKTKEREQEEYGYALKQERANQDDIYAQERKKLSEDLEQIREAKEEEWAAREKEVVAKEDEAKDYAAKYDELEKRQDKEVKKAEAEGRSLIERDHKVKMKLLKTDVNGEQQALDLQISSLEASITKQQAQIESLQAKLEKAAKQTQDIAMRKLELELTTNQESYAKLHDLAMEQAKNSGKGK